MAKLTKKAEILKKLHTLVEKEGALAQTNISGVPGSDTSFTSVSESNETTDQNSIGPEKLNDKQKYEQKPATDEAEPLAGAKTASEAQIDKLANSILESIQSKLQPQPTEKEAAEAQTNISGKPGKDTNFESVADKNETTDQNAVGPEKLNDKQKHSQKPATDSATPLANAKTAEELNKEASYRLGAQFCEALVKRASLIKQAEAHRQQVEMVKEAGRRDFEALIQQAALEIKQAEDSRALAAKQAEEYGAAQFDAMLKQAQLEALQEENRQLKIKVAEYVSFEKEAQAQFEAAQRKEEHTKLAHSIIEELKRELIATKAQ